MGLAIAERFVAEGCHVTMFSNDRGALETEARRLGALAVPGDLRSSTDLAVLVGQTVQRHGSIDILINNGGGPSQSTAVGTSETQLAEAVGLLLTSAVFLTNACLSQLAASGHGRVITISSTSVREPIESLVLSNTVRPAVVGWMKTLADEVGPQAITVNLVAPGRIQTRTFAEFYRGRSPADDLARIPLRRFGDPSEVADLVCFLASDRAAYITGTVVTIDGGLTRAPW
jgi:3-oxoacyl-[acyl-carrier protein] reductase